MSRPDEEDADIRIRGTEALRRRFKAAAAEEGDTYEDLLDKLLVFRETNEREFRQSNLTRRRER